MGRTIWVVSIAFGCAVSAGVTAQERKGDSKRAAAALDNNFLVKVFSANNAEIEYSKLAGKRAGSQQVKDFAQQMIKDHRDAQDALGRLVKDRKLGIVAGLEKDVRDEVDRLSRLEGAEFDRAYMKRMVEDHDRAVSLFETQARDGKDDAVTAWAKEMLPTLQKHQQRAKEIEAGLGKR